MAHFCCCKICREITTTAAAAANAPATTTLTPPPPPTTTPTSIFYKLLTAMKTLQKTSSSGNGAKHTCFLLLLFWGWVFCGFVLGLFLGFFFFWGGGGEGLLKVPATNKVYLRDRPAHTITTIIIIAFKGAIRDLFTVSSLHRQLSPCHMYAQVAQAQSCANHMQLIERLSRASAMLRATWYEGTAQLLSLTELKWHLF